MIQVPLSRRKTLQLLGTAALAGVLPRIASAAPVTIEQIKKAGVLHVGCEAAYVPFTYRDSSGKIVGFDVEVVGRYLAAIGVKPEFIDTQWSGVIPALYAGRFEMVPTMSYTKERLEDKDLWKIYRQQYAAEPFVRIVKEGTDVWLRS